MKVNPDFREVSMWAKTAEHIKSALEYAETKSDLEMQMRIMRIYVSLQKILSLLAEKDTEDDSISNCAYCGHPNPEVTAINKERSSEDVLTFILKCRACKKEDWPSAIREDLMKILN